MIAVLFFQVVIRFLVASADRRCSSEPETGSEPSFLLDVAEFVRVERVAEAVAEDVER